MFYTVYVGGVEVTDHYVNETCALEIVQEWLNDGYDDVQMVRMKEDLK
jgi:hypothetical protein